MKTWISGLMALFLLACASSQATSPPEPKPVPDFTLESLDGAVFRGQEQWADEPVLLVFMASWCAVCREEVPALNLLAKDHKVLAIASGDSRADLEKTRQQTGMTYPVLLDDSGEVARAYRVVASPTCIVVDGDGIERYRGRLPPKAL